MARWRRKPQEREGNYLFAGRGFITSGIAHALTSREIAAIYADLMAFVREKGGVDYLQVYVSEDGRKVWCIDQLSRTALEGERYTEEEKQEYNYWTMLLPEEY